MKLNKMMKHVVAGLSAVAISALSLAAFAQAPFNRGNDFGAKGQFSVNVDLPFTSDAPQFAIYNTSVSGQSGSTTSFTIAPALDYFVAQNLSIGGQVGFTHDSFSTPGSNVSLVGSGFVLGIRGGINIPLAPAASLWPRLSLTYRSLSGDGWTNSWVPLTIFVPLLWHPASHFFLGGGPVFSTELSNSYETNGLSVDGGKTTVIGLQAVVGGYF
ncbi:MAG TPA: hypothetical protein VHU40_10590 [Polyangia bacterium]|jgi:hypothetical protein|nr:hypothetical protein [Polyangia bacterium]